MIIWIESRSPRGARDVRSPNVTHHQLFVLSRGEVLPQFSVSRMVSTEPGQQRSELRLVHEPPLQPSPRKRRRQVVAPWLHDFLNVDVEGVSTRSREGPNLGRASTSKSALLPAPIRTSEPRNAVAE